MLFVVEGKVAYQMDNGIFVLRPGDIMFHKPYNKHCPLVLNNDALYERIILQIEPKKLESLSRYGIDFSICFKLGNPGVFRIPYYAQNSIRMTLGKILGVSQEHPFGHELLADVYITELFVKISEFFYDEKLIVSVEELQPIQLLSMVDQFIEENIDSPIRIDDLASFVCMNKYSFMRYFKDLSGCTAYQYVVSKRLKAAESLIKSGMGLSSAAEKCGFSDYSCFYRCFMNKYKISPQKYFEALIMGNGTCLEIC
jgi:AraC-like DNA-binding protein